MSNSNCDGIDVAYHFPFGVSNPFRDCLFGVSNPKSNRDSYSIDVEYHFLFGVSNPYQDGSAISFLFGMSNRNPTIVTTMALMWHTISFLVCQTRIAMAALMCYHFLIGRSNGTVAVISYLVH